jgi:NOP5NT (NUC127) domain
MRRVSVAARQLHNALDLAISQEKWSNFRATQKPQVPCFEMVFILYENAMGYAVFEACEQGLEDLAHSLDNPEGAVAT